MKLRNFIQKLHNSSRRKYLERMVSKKVKCMGIAKKYSKDYWDGDRKYGYGGYKFIEGRWRSVALNLIKTYKLKNSSKILDAGCGKGYLLYELRRLLPDLKISGFDISKYAIRNSHPKIKRHLYSHKAQKKFLYKNKEFDLVISLGVIHNLNIKDVFFTLKEIQRVGKKSYVMTESYNNDQELFNLQCWALTCESFFSPKEWEWIFKNSGFKGDYEFIYFR
tara:strand:- start:949 stop:1611 length:663 start_codon:yes stop_codon:yes gene_type:complete